MKVARKKNIPAVGGEEAVTLRYHEVGYDEKTVDLRCRIESMEHAQVWVNYLLRHRSDMILTSARPTVIRYNSETGDWLEILW